jgi:hypothetical protein
MEKMIDDMFLKETLGKITLCGAFTSTYTDMCIDGTYKTLVNQYGKDHVVKDSNLILKAGPVMKNEKGEYEVKAWALKEAVIKKLRKEDRDDRPAEQQQWGLYTSDGSRLLGRHPSKEQAKKHERAVQYFKHRASKVAHMFLQEGIKWGCVGCKKDTKNEPSYTVNDALWKKLGMNEKDNLCFNCLERMMTDKLGRSLEKSDFSQFSTSPNNLKHPKVREIMK